MGSRVPLPGDIRTVFAQAGYSSLFASLQRDFPFDSLFLSGWNGWNGMGWNVLLISYRLKLSYPVIASSSRVRSMTPSLTVFRDNRIALDYSRMNFP